MKWHCLSEEIQHFEFPGEQTNALLCNLYIFIRMCIYMNKIERSEIRHNKLKPENVIEIQIRFR